jgi:hypothetical protein
MAQGRIALNHVRVKRVRALPWHQQHGSPWQAVQINVNHLLFLCLLRLLPGSGVLQGLWVTLRPGILLPVA